MPNLDFYALGNDHRLFLEFVFLQPGWTLRDMVSPYEQPIRVFTSASDLLNAREVGAKPQHFVLWSPEMGGRVTHRRVNFTLEASAKVGATHRFEASGWGLIQLYTGFVRDGLGLAPSHTNHNSAARAAKWHSTYEEWGRPEDWDWTAVQRISARLNRYIAKVAQSKSGSRPVLPDAHDAVARGMKLLVNG